MPHDLLLFWNRFKKGGDKKFQLMEDRVFEKSCKKEDNNQKCVTCTVLGIWKSSCCCSSTCSRCFPCRLSLSLCRRLSSSATCSLDFTSTTWKKANGNYPFLVSFYLYRASLLVRSGKNVCLMRLYDICKAVMCKSKPHELCSASVSLIYFCLSNFLMSYSPYCMMQFISFILIP